MTKEEAIQILIESKDETIERTMQEWDEYDKKLYQAIDMAIEALKTESSAEGKYEKAIRTLQEMPRYLNGVKEKQIKKISADAEHGVWEHIESTLADNMFKCSKCGNPLIIPTVDGEPIYNYCLHCGAKMGNAWGERND